MAIDSAVYIDYFFTQQLDVFTIDDFYKFLKGKGVKITKTQARDLVNSSELVFPLVDDRYITRAGVFSLRWFSFKPSKEEVKKGYVILGHRCMPFVNPEIAPDQIMLETTDGNIIETAAVSFSTNLAMDVFALFGEGYVIPYILNDPANESVPLSSLKYTIPTEVSLTAWPLKAITGNGKKFKYGDRILCKVTDWNMNIVEVSPLYSEPSDTLSAADIEREEWYSVFEKGLLENFDTMGPASSIEEQLAFLYLENQKKLCIKNCGSAEEFLQHTKKIGFAPYGVESRIWKAGQEIPYIGPWNEGVSSDAIFTDMAMVFSVQIIDCYLKNRLYENEKNRQNQTLEELCHTIFPSVLKMSVPEFKMLLLNIEKRNVIITQSYNSFAEYKIAPVRNRVVRLFSQVNNLVCSIGNSGLALENFPQQELVILIQLFSHIIRIIEEMEDEIRVENFPVDDICMSLDGMEETFDDVGEILSKSLEANTYNEMKIVN